MDCIEKGLQSIDTQTKSAIQKHKELLAKSIFETASKSNSSSASFDKKSYKVFEGLDQIGREESKAFNPHTVVEFRDGKAFQVIDTWDEVNGILPNRKVMGTYYVDIGLEMPHEIVNYCTANKERVYPKYQFVPSDSNSLGNLNFNNKSNTYSITYQKYHTSLYRIFPNDPIYERKEKQRNMLNIEKTITFQVDNYLNLFHVETGLYLMLHKTSFPDICFYLSREITQLPGVDCWWRYQIYLSKRLEKLDLEMTQEKYSSIDNREKLLNDINQLIPQTYQRIYKLYNSFRKFQTFKPDVENETLETEEAYKDTSQIDPKDRIIDALKIKLNEAIKRCENAESIVSDMVDKFNEKSVKIQSLDREKGLLEIKIKELEGEMTAKQSLVELEIEKLKKEHQELILNVEEKKDRESFGLYKRLNEAEVFKSKSDELGISVKSLKNELEKSELNRHKIKDINTGLVDQIKQEKERLEKLTNDNEELLKQLMELKEHDDSITNKNKELLLNIEEKNKECWYLGEKLSKIGESSSNALENALSDQIDTLKNDIIKLKEDNLTLTNENTKVNNQLSKMKSTLSSIL